MCATAVLPRVTSVYGTMSSLSVAVRSLYPKNSVTVSAARALAAPRGAALGQACETTLQMAIVRKQGELDAADERTADTLYALEAARLELLHAFDD